MIGAANSIQNKNSQNSVHLLNLEMEQKDIMHGHKQLPLRTIRPQWPIPTSWVSMFH